MKEAIQLLALIALFAITMSLVGQQVGNYLNSSNSIVIQEGNTEVVYIRGEACTVNMGKTNDVSGINTNMIWCMEQHLNYLGESK